MAQSSLLVKDVADEPLCMSESVKILPTELQKQMKKCLMLEFEERPDYDELKTELNRSLMIEEK